VIDMPLTQAELNEIKERAEKATQGPWGIDFPLLVCDQCGNTYEIVQSDVFLAPVVAESKSEADAEFIAHAREDIPNLLDHIAELETEIERLDLFLQEIDTHIRSTPEPLPYIIETMRNYLDYREELANDVDY
jgi:uncharacterized protein YbaR (Trm112 family)